MIGIFKTYIHNGKIVKFNRKIILWLEENKYDAENIQREITLFFNI